jgi:ACS family hexuronate transporter-like MFS transporter
MQIGQKAPTPFITGGIGNFAGGIVCKWLMTVGCPAQTARSLYVFFLLGLMTATAWAATVESATISIVLISVATFGYCGALTNLLAIPGDLFPENAVASVWGLASMGAGIGGIVFSQMTGLLVDHYSFRPAFLVFGATAAALVWCLPWEEQLAAH